MSEIKTDAFPEADGWAEDRGAPNVSGAPVCRAYNDREPVMVTCWRFPWMDRLRLLFGGKLYVAVRGNRQPALWMRTDRSDVFVEDGGG